MTRLINILVLATSLFFRTGAVAAQQDSTVEWKSKLVDLERRLAGLDGTEDVAAWRADAEALRSSLAAFAALHPTDGLTIPEALPADASAERLARQLAALSRAIDELIRLSPGSPFNLGIITVTVSAALSPPAPVADSIDQTGIEAHNALNAAQALNYLPGVSIQHIAANRNEAGVMVRGFSTRGQVPLYLDGAPIYVPYDGYVDFNRFLTGDVAELQVTRGYSSPLLGPNALGGSINLITKEPARRYEGDALIGTGSGDTLLSSLRLGSRRRRFFMQGSLDWLQAGFIPLSANFPVYQYPGLPHTVMTDRLNHSDSRDERFSGRAGWIPREGDSYVFSYSNQKGRKDVPLYQGPNLAAPFRNFWKWPYWNTDGYYFHSSTALGGQTVLKVRAFYNQFRNAIDMYSDDTYTVMNTRSAEHSIYDEHTGGASAELDTHPARGNELGISFFVKDDVHKEHGIYPGMAPYPLITPILRDRDRLVSIGLQDSVSLGPRLKATLGFSADHLDGLDGQSYNSSLTAVVPFTCLSDPRNTSFHGCTAHVWDFNPQVALAYKTGESGNLFFTFSDRGRFPLLKETYSTSMWAGLPNPDLRPEHSRNLNAGYSRLFGLNTLLQITLFRSDLRDAVESVYVSDPGGYCPNSKIIGYCSQMANIGAERHEGVEIGVHSTPLARFTLDASYSYLNRTIFYDFGSFSNVSRVNTSIISLPTLPRNKLLGTVTVRLPQAILAMAALRYEGGLTLQDTTYASSSRGFLPFAESYATFDIGAALPIRNRITAQAGAKNLFDRSYFYTAGYPEAGRSWYLNLRCRF
jgi:iron complex outermembrane receptor protein